MKVGSIVRLSPDIKVPKGERVFGVALKTTETTGVKDVLIFWLGVGARTQFEWIYSVNLEEVL
tara:strand:+ start:110 stop:298 length:189 start_codon:yes stop_codon:yes gene_type:complete